MRAMRVGNGQLPRRWQAMSVCLSSAALCLALSGCGNTLSGAKRDVATDTQGVRNSASTVVADAKDKAAGEVAKAKDAAGGVVGRARDSVSGAETKAKDAVLTAQASGKDLVSQAQTSASTLAGKAQNSAEGLVRKTQAEEAKIKSVPENADAAVVITPEVKTAIIRDPVLDDPHNAIDVNSHDQAVHLTGHVASSLMKRRAEEDAQAVLAKRHPGYQVVDELAVQHSQP